MDRIMSIQAHVKTSNPALKPSEIDEDAYPHNSVDKYLRKILGLDLKKLQPMT
jgi:hypothetical protein